MAKKKQDTTIPGGCYIIDAELREDESVPEDSPDRWKHYGGRLTNAEGQTIREFNADEVNTGMPEDAKGKDKPLPTAAETAAKGKGTPAPAKP